MEQEQNQLQDGCENQWRSVESDLLNIDVDITDVNDVDGIAFTSPLNIRILSSFSFFFIFISSLCFLDFFHFATAAAAYGFSCLQLRKTTQSFRIVYNVNHI